MARAGRLLGVAALFIGLTVLMTWPHALHIASRSFESHDVFFNAWRLRWIHHALTTSPASLFDGNQFYPERGSLAYSDALLFEGLVAAPLFSLGLGTMLVHNLLLLGAIAASGIGMFALARRLWNSVQGAVIAGVIFAFAPYRFAHYMHMELQWAMWMPAAFWALQRTLDGQSPGSEDPGQQGTEPHGSPGSEDPGLQETGPRASPGPEDPGLQGTKPRGPGSSDPGARDSGAPLKYGLLTGAFVALQILSCIYYGLFLLATIAVLAALQLPFADGRRRRQAIGGLAAGAAIVAATAGAYALPYRQTSALAGTRAVDEIRQYSARASSYLRVPEENRLRGRPHGGTRSVELSLYPGVVPVMLAIGSLVFVRRSRTILVCVAGLLLALDFSLGLNGLIYPQLQAHVGPFRFLRAPARASLLLLMFLGLLAARGHAAAIARVRRRSLRVALSVAATALILVEYWSSPLRLVRYPVNPPLARFLAAQPPGVVAELPVPRVNLLPAHDARYIYISTYHWKPLVNGYSGYVPPSYVARMWRLVNFPGADAMAQLRADGVRYVVVHEGSYATSAESGQAVDALVRSGAATLGRYFDGWAAASVFELR